MMLGIDSRSCKRFTGIVLCISTASWTSLPARADTVSLSPAADNTLYEDVGGTLSGGSGANFFAGRSGPGGGSRALRGVLRFDVSGVPAGSLVTSVTLRVNMNQTSGGILSIEAHRLLQTWGEGTTVPPSGGGGGGASTSNSATWIHTFYSNSFWTSAGGDFESVDSANIFMQNTGSYDFSSTNSPALILDVQSWIDTPSTNFGWLLKSSTEVSGAMRFDSRESGTPSNRPALIVGYTPPALTLSAFSRSAAGFSNSWSAISGQVYRMEFTTNALGAQAWTQIGDVTATTAAVGMLDPTVTNYRLYRILNLQF